MWGYLVLGAIIGMLMFFLFYCIWSFVDDCKTTSDMMDRLEYRADNLRADITSLWTSVHCLERDLDVVVKKIDPTVQPTKERGDGDAHSGTDAC